jgi:hypothetical protein
MIRKIFIITMFITILFSLFMVCGNIYIHNTEYIIKWSISCFLGIISLILFIILLTIKE